MNDEGLHPLGGRTLSSHRERGSRKHNGGREAHHETQGGHPAVLMLTTGFSSRVGWLSDLREVLRERRLDATFLGDTWLSEALGVGVIDPHGELLARGDFD